MKKLTITTLLLAGIFSAGAQADADGMTLQQQREQIRDDMVRDRTGSAPAEGGGINQSVDPAQQPGPNQQAPGGTFNSPQNAPTNPQAPTYDRAPTLQRQPQPGTGAPTTGDQPSAPGNSQSAPVNGSGVRSSGGNGGGGFGTSN